MIFEDKIITLKDGREAILKSPCSSDAEKLLYVIKTASGETEFLARYPEEWNVGVEFEEAWINKMRSSSNALPITCYIGGTPVGTCEISFKTGIKMSHRASIGISILKDYWNIGIGSAMFTELISEAKKWGIEILELEFLEGNERGRHLYEKFGFEIVCSRPNAVKLKSGRYLSEIFMQKKLSKKEGMV